AFVLDPQGLGLLMTIPKGGSVYDILEITALMGAGLGALAAAAQGWAIRRASPVERWLFALAGVLLVFPSPLQALFGAATGFDIPYPAALGLALGAGLLLWQWKGPPRPVPA